MKQKQSGTALLRAFLGVVLGMLGPATLLWAQPPQVVAVRAGRLFDPISGTLIRNQIVLIQGERIVELGPADRIKVPAGAEEIDLS